jgi:Putative Actinobacterial Holin-X, holin superfamily III
MSPAYGLCYPDRSMPEPKQIPELVAELVDMSKEYLRQETLEPAKRLGRFAGMSLGGAVLFSFAAVLLTLGLFALLRRLLPDTQWWAVLARLFTALGAGGAAALIAWRMSDDDHKS